MLSTGWQAQSRATTEATMALELLRQVVAFGPIFLVGLSMCSIIAFIKKYLLRRVPHRTRMVLWIVIFVPPMGLAMWWSKHVLQSGDAWPPAFLAAALYILGAIASLELQKWIDRKD
ncbi:MAG: hypothetical protein A2854_02665 [Parcubacteria group bacterium RIFCSPHIGHO2_01_FULL_56_18]|nr:MAG: hypothetical protein A2854_02665 [Parcubacteria group bacterium RIFCSPHIGHO2_01_FULL_56_18]